MSQPQDTPSNSCSTDTGPQGPIQSRWWNTSVSISQSDSERRTQEQQQGWPTGNHERVRRAESEQCQQTEVQLSRRRPTVHLAKPLYLLIFESPNQTHSLQDAISLSPCQTKQPNISISFLSSCLAADQWTWAGVTTHMLVLGMLYHKQNLLFHCKRKFLKFNFLIKFIFNDQTLSNIMYTAGVLIRKKKDLWKESWSK